MTPVKIKLTKTEAMYKMNWKSSRFNLTSHFNQLCKTKGKKIHLIIISTDIYMVKTTVLVCSSTWCSMVKSRLLMAWRKIVFHGVQSSQTKLSDEDIFFLQLIISSFFWSINTTAFIRSCWIRVSLSVGSYLSLHICEFVSLFFLFIFCCCCWYCGYCCWFVFF